MLNHLPFEKLADLAEGRLRPEEHKTLQSHVSSCPRCAQKLSRLEALIASMQSDRAEDAPPALISNAIHLFGARSDGKEPSLLKRIAAALSFDSFQMSPAYGVRSTQAAARQLLYSAGDYDLDLRLAQSGEVWNVSGQVLGEECAGGGRIEFVGPSSSASAELNEQCEFTLSALPAGNYQLRLWLQDLEVEIPELELKA